VVSRSCSFSHCADVFVVFELTNPGSVEQERNGTRPQSLPRFSCVDFGFASAHSCHHILHRLGDESL
jgi:hypothetical protein